MDGTGFQVKARGRIDLPGQRVEPGCPDDGVRRKPDVVETLHHVAEDGALCATRGAHLLPHLGFVVGLTLGPHDHDTDILVEVDARDRIVGAQHVLVQKVSHGEQVRVVADRHHRDDLLPVQEQRQRTFGHNARSCDLPGMIHALDLRRQSRIAGVGADQEFTVRVVCFHHTRLWISCRSVSMTQISRSGGGECVNPILGHGRRVRQE